MNQVEETAKNTGNLMPVIVEAVEADATVGEISDAMRHVYGEHYCWMQVRRLAALLGRVAMAELQSSFPPNLVGATVLLVLGLN